MISLTEEQKKTLAGFLRTIEVDALCVSAAMIVMERGEAKDPAKTVQDCSHKCSDIIVATSGIRETLCLPLPQKGADDAAE